MSSKEESLAKTYRQMSTADINRRLHSGKLDPLAAEMAREELDARRQLEWLSQDGDPDTTSNFGMYFGAGLVLVIFAVYVATIMEPEDRFLLWLSLALGFCSLIGRLFPWLGLVCGALLALWPLGLTIMLYRGGDLAWKGGDFRPLWSLVTYFFLGLVWLILLGMGSAMIAGAVSTLRARSTQGGG
ncbi:MAG: hypothetical protein QM776_10225 [Rhodocyclaceae bacterium]